MSLWPSAHRTWSSKWAPPATQLSNIRIWWIYFIPRILSIPTKSSTGDPNPEVMLTLKPWRRRPSATTGKTNPMTAIIRLTQKLHTMHIKSLSQPHEARVIALITRHLLSILSIAPSTPTSSLTAAWVVIVDGSRAYPCTTRTSTRIGQQM
jgi:hypothetical protein